MPFRDRGLPRALSRMLWYALAVVVLLIVGTWLLFAVRTLPGGWQHMTPGTRLLLLGFAGIPIVNLLIGSVGLALTQDSIHEGHEHTDAQVAALRSELAEIKALLSGGSGGNQP